MIKDKVIVVIQARMRSSRLPGKVLLPLYDRPALQWVADRCAIAERVDGVIIATTADPANDPIEEALGKDYLVYRYGGDEEDVLGRVLAAAKWIGADIIVDVSGDCPCIDPRHIDFLFEMLKTEQADYASNVVERTFPDGCDVQVCTVEALAKVRKLYNPPFHCSWNISRYPQTFKILNWPAPPHMYWPSLAITLDTLEDYELLKIIFDYFGCNPAFAVEKVIEYLKTNPSLLDINRKVRRKNPEEEG